MFIHINVDKSVDKYVEDSVEVFYIGERLRERRRVLGKTIETIHKLFRVDSDSSSLIKSEGWSRMHIGYTHIHVSTTTTYYIY